MHDSHTPSPVSRDDLVRSLAQGLRFGRTRIHHGDDLMARLAAEKLADFMAEANLVVVQGGPAPDDKEHHHPALPTPA